MTRTHSSPALVPILSAGRHRTPRKGACFMEFASYLAGERWSDHPACTHPALAFLARMVNDCTSDRERSRLAELIPSVIALNGDDPRIELLLALRVATNALPIASEPRQRALAVGILACRMRLARFGPSDDADLESRIDEALAKAPLAARWARDFVAGNTAPARGRSVSRRGAGGGGGGPGAGPPPPRGGAAGGPGAPRRRRRSACSASHRPAAPVRMPCSGRCCAARSRTARRCSGRPQPNCGSRVRLLLSSKKPS